MKHVFISYAHKDGPFVQELVDELKLADIRCWLDSKLIAGTEWKDAIDDNIKDAFAVVVVLSAHAVASQYVAYEWAYARGHSIQVIPLLVETGLNVHPVLERIQYISFVDGRRPWNQLIERLRQLEPASFVRGRIPRLPNRNKLTIGPLEIDWIVLQSGWFVCDKVGRIRTFYDPKPIPLVREIARMYRDCKEDYESRQKRGEVGVPHNGPGYKLTSFDTSFREVVAGEEIPVLILNFAPTDYYTQVVTDLNRGNAIREGFAKKIDTTAEPVPQFASILGVNLSLVTSDNYLIVADRGGHMLVASHQLHTAVGENLNRPADANSDGAPDVFRAAVRGTLEEIGVQLKSEQVFFTTFGVHPGLCQYSLIGWSKLDQTRDEILSRRALGTPKDKYEHRDLHFIPFNADDIASFICRTRDRWFDIGLAAVALAMFQTSATQEQIEQALEKHWR